MILTHDPFVPTPNSIFSDEEKHKNNPKYFKDMVEYTDLIIGRIINKLKEENLIENSLVIFVGDNGTHKSIVSQMDNVSFTGAKGTTTTAGTHVPMIVSFGKSNKDMNISEDLIDFTDFLPTLLEVAGVTNNRIPHKDGRSFLPQINGEAGNKREWIFCDYNPKWGKRKKSRYAQTKKWKLYEDGSFYDFSKDTEENKSISINDLTPADLDIYNQLQDVLNNLK